MKLLFLAILSVFLLTACNGWIIQPLPSNPPTPFLPFTPTPSIFTQTPVVIGVTSVSSTPVLLTSTPQNKNTPVPTNTEQHQAVATYTPTTPMTATDDPYGNPAVSVKVLGCNTSIDVTHGMGEVTNAYVTLTNTGSIQLTSLKVTLNALDEGREHPNKTVEIDSLPAGYQVTLKLTVDSTYKQETPIQVATVSDQGTFPLEGLASCKDLGLFTPKPDVLNTPIPFSQ